MTLEEFEQELIKRGFDGLSQPERFRYINWGYYRVAKYSRWYWERGTVLFTLTPGQFSYDLGSTVKSVVSLYSTTTNYRSKLTVADEEDFAENWLPLDLADASNAGEPTAYFLWGNQLYVLPPPQSSRDFLANVYNRVTELQQNTDTPLTPPDQDEAILLAALVSAHQRVNQPDLANDARIRLEEEFDIALSEETLRDDEFSERTEPDPAWQNFP